MKHLYIFFILISGFTFSQIPANYYDSANGLTGYALKTELRNITANGHIARSYDQLYDGQGISGSQGYVDTHSDVNVSSGNIYENDGTVLDFYSENPVNPNSPNPSTNNDPYNFTHNQDNGGNQTQEGDCYNREHLVPQSSYNSAFPMQSDIHQVIPTDCRVNNFRGSLPFGEVASANWTSDNGSKRGSSDISGYSGTMFEPIDEFKGDIARALLYFATRYENTVNNYTSFDMFNGTNDQVFHTWAVDMLLDWHYNVDPVDQRERDRNNAAYNFQGNANPFVDHPEYANMIWNPTPDTEAPTTPTNLTASNPTDNTIDLSWTAATDNIGVVSYTVLINDTNTYNTNNSNISITATGLDANTSYCFKVKAVDAAGNESSYSNEACETTTNNGNQGGSVDLFISEYIEGSSTNKALEIANFTGDIVNLNNYTLKLATNGNGFSTTYSFPNNVQIANGDVFVVGNSGLNSSCASADDTNNSITGFNGNDVIGLFKNDVLIDIIGVLGSTSDFAKNVTLVRNANISQPNTTYTPAEWTFYSIDTCNDLGSHTQTLNLDDFQKEETIKMYPNPLNGNTLFIKSNSKVSTTIYNILGKKILTSKDSEINVSNLKSGVYLVKIETSKGVTTKKLIKN